MRTLGLIGGMSWESTLLYYRLLNERVQAQLGGLHSAPCIIYSLDFAPIAAWQNQGKWNEAAKTLCAAAQHLESIGAEGLVLCTNTMHKLAPSVQAAVKIPLLHIVDATAHSIKCMGLQKMLLLGTRFTMEDPFYRDHMRDHFNVEICVPQKTNRDFIHGVIYDELCKGVIRGESRDRCLDLIEQQHSEGIEGVILGCTELTLLLKPEHTSIPLFDSSALHVSYAMDWAMLPVSTWTKNPK